MCQNFFYFLPSSPRVNFKTLLQCFPRDVGNKKKENGKRASEEGEHKTKADKEQQNAAVPLLPFSFLVLSRGQALYPIMSRYSKFRLESVSLGRLWETEGTATRQLSFRPCIRFVSPTFSFLILFPRFCCRCYSAAAITRMRTFYGLEFQIGLFTLAL